MRFFRHPVFFIGLRYLLAKQDNRLFSFTSLISVAGLTIGVMALVLVLSVFNGAQGIQRDRTLITVPHGDISAKAAVAEWQILSAQLSKQPNVLAVAPYVPIEAMLSEHGYHQVTQIRAIDPQAELQVSPVASSMVNGRLDALAPGANGIVIGRALASNLRLYPGDSVNLVVPQSNKAGNRVSLENYRFTVVGIFDVQYDIGSDLAYINLQDSRTLLGSSSIAERLHLRVKTANIDQARATVASGVALLNALYPQADFSGEDWSVTQASLFNALKLEKVMTWFMLMMIVAIGAFNIISTLVMVVSEKQADIAILRTMGAGQSTIMGIFLVQGALLGIAGIIAGALCGIALTLNFAQVSGFLAELISPDGLYLISELPAQLHGSDVWLTCGFALLITLLATLYPAWKASRILPAQVLRYE